MGDDQMVSQEAKQPQVYQLLRHAILSDGLQPGERLVERKLAERFGVSRTPVREAIRKLESEGLVKHIPRRGVVVAPVSPQEAWEVYNIRSVLEGLAARMAAEWISPEAVEKMGKLVEEMERAVNQKDMERLNQLNIDFNELVYQSAQAPRLHKMIDNLVDYIIGFTKVGYSLPGRVHEVIQEHKSLYEAIRKGDGEEAERVGRRHVERSCETYFIQRALSEGQVMPGKKQRRKNAKPPNLG